MIRFGLVYASFFSFLFLVLVSPMTFFYGCRQTAEVVTTVIVDGSIFGDVRNFLLQTFVYGLFTAGL